MALLVLGYSKRLWLESTLSIGSLLTRISVTMLLACKE